MLTTQVQKRKGADTVSGRPFMIKVEATNLCRFSCPGCYTGTASDTHPKGKMPLELFRSILDALGRDLLKIVLHAWGEPLLHEKIYEMIRLAQDRNIGTMVSTNLNDFRKQDTEKLFGSGLEHLIVSVDGMTQGTYERYRRGGDLHRVLDNLAHILYEKKGPPRKVSARGNAVYRLSAQHGGNAPGAQEGQGTGRGPLDLSSGTIAGPREPGLSQREQAAGTQPLRPALDEYVHQLGRDRLPLLLCQ